VSRLEGVQQAFASSFGVDPDKITAATVPEEVKKWDSLGHMTLVAALEERFGLQFEVDEIMEMATVAAILSILEAKGVKE
jgi:acyl carrier protein